MSEEEEVVEIAATAIEDAVNDVCEESIPGVYIPAAGWPKIAQALLTALEAKGYTITRSRHGIIHGREPFVPRVL
jgi:hypothetical protein